MKKQPLLIFILGLFAAGAGFLLYARYGHVLIQAVYEGRSAPFLNSFIEGQQAEPLKTYLDYGDALAFTLAVFFLAGLAFYSQKDFFRGLSRREQWGMAGIVIFLLVAALEFRPEFKENELVKLIPIRMLTNPGLFARDWSLQSGSFSNFVFDGIVSPFALILSDLPLVMVGRILAWMLVVIAMVRLARTLGLHPLELILGFAFWFYAGQSLAAEETILGSFEAKPFAYAFLFFALTSLLKGKVFKTALFCGLSVLFHLLVGLWGSLGVFVAWYFTPNHSRFRFTLLWGLSVFCFAIPQLFTVIAKALEGGLPDPGSYVIRVLFREPHHLDPDYFLSGGRGLEILLYSLITIPVLWKTFPRETARQLIGFLAAVMGIFVLGYAARRFGAFPFLFLYPFRLGPLFLLLFFSLGFFRFVRLYGSKASWTMRLGCFAVCFFVGAQAFHREVPQRMLKGTAGSLLAWRQYVRTRGEDDFKKTSEWIQKNTPSESVFIAPPWEYRFWLFTRRAQVVSFKVTPVSRALKEWHARLVDLNGGLTFQHTAGGVLKEFRQNYPHLTAAQLGTLGEKYSADYYLTTQPRSELPFPLRYSNPSYFLYELRKTPGSRRSV